MAAPPRPPGAAPREPLSVNGRTYAWPDRPLVVVCIDGCEPDYFDRAIEAGAMPYLASARAAGTDRLADAAMPTFTNPNNLSIVTGVPPAVHGISGNYFYDPEAGAEVMMNEPRYLRAGSILGAFSEAGARVAIVTAKDKLRRLLGHGVRGICFSSEKAHETTRAEHGIDGALDLVGRPLPSVYSATSRSSCSRRACASWRPSGPTSCSCRPRTTCSTSTPRGRPRPTRSTG